MNVDIILIMFVLAVLSGYIITSIILLKFPHVVHSKKKTRFICSHISHRGGSGENLENTMLAFKHSMCCSAVQTGTDMLELDCQITKDGVVVVSHDDDLDRVCGRHARIQDLDYQDLPQLLPQLKTGYPPDHLCHGGSDRQIARFEDVLREFPEIPLNVDVKRNDDRLIAAVYKEIVAQRCQDRVVWGNFSDSVMKKLFLEDPNIAILFSVRRVALLVFLFYTGLLPFIPLKEKFFEIPMPSIAFRMQRFAEAPLRYRLLIRIIDMLLMRKSLFDHLTKRGIQTYVWVLNDEEDYERAFRAGATGVMTDYPTKLRQFLDSKPQYDAAKLHRLTM